MWSVEKKNENCRPDKTPEISHLFEQTFEGVVRGPHGLFAARGSLMARGCHPIPPVGEDIDNLLHEVP